MAIDIDGHAASVIDQAVCGAFILQAGWNLDGLLRSGDGDAARTGREDSRAQRILLAGNALPRVVAAKERKCRLLVGAVDGQLRVSQMTGGIVIGRGLKLEARNSTSRDFRASLSGDSELGLAVDFAADFAVQRTGLDSICGASSTWRT